MMQTLLRIDSSLRKEGSYSRMYGDIFVQMWKERNPGSKINYRDINKDRIPHLTQEVTQAFFGRAEDDGLLEISDMLCEEIWESDAVLLTCPMYNFGIPSTLKSYFDHVIRVNRTFRYHGDQGYEGLLKNKKAYVITSMGGKKTDLETSEPFEQYLQQLLGFMGIEDIKMVSINGTASEDFILDQEIHYTNQVKQMI
ncbi:NAD(P)H-dependent oxidoreductase [Allomuricauda taeanensis]|uniref:FMN-dependent NADH-azoreductase n=1 Tax=Flagellimonas taeanensis TaxID=1005926 RepID=UPI002E7AF9B2|nr:NAD(P)H-dependent oxidoreductase [Allomuricauda taeanensis]MEE1963525.1 NAD(P)H-dependent oxidoreductase [Allomuricauda taeanensis]